MSTAIEEAWKGKRICEEDTNTYKTLSIEFLFDPLKEATKQK
jgi:hypothetical protein